MWQQIKRWLLPVTASLALWACAAPAAGPAETEAAGAAPKETIVFSDLNWTSAQIQTRIAQYVVEFGYGYPTEQVFGNTLPLFQALRRGDTHVTMENWLPNLQEPWNEAVEGGEVVPLGQSLGRDWQSAFVIPAYLQAQYPDLDHVEDLKDERFTQLFATAETHGKARLLTCVIGWACEVVNAEQVAGYGLADYVEIVAPGDAAAMNADLYGAYEIRNRGWVSSGAPTTPRSCWIWCAWRNRPIPTNAGPRTKRAPTTTHRWKSACIRPCWTARPTWSPC